jgi:hypothetical protein
MRGYFPWIRAAVFVHFRPEMRLVRDVLRYPNHSLIRRKQLLSAFLPQVSTTSIGTPKRQLSNRAGRTFDERTLALVTDCRTTVCLPNSDQASAPPAGTPSSAIGLDYQREST